MSKLKKMKERIKNIPTDFHYNEAKTLLNALGFEEVTKGRTSESRVRFYRESDSVVMDLHKPHPQSIMRKYAVKQIVDKLKECGDLL